MKIDESQRFITLPENTDRCFELIDGHVYEKLPTEEHGLILERLIGRLFAFIEPRNLGRAGIKVEYHLPDDKHNYLMPDLSLTRTERLLPTVTRGAVPQPPVFIVEVLSRDDTFADLSKKATYYLAHGVQLVWLIYPERQTAEIWKPNAEPQVLTLSDTLDGGDLLPGFTLPLA